MRTRSSLLACHERPSKASSTSASEVVLPLSGAAVTQTLFPPPYNLPLPRGMPVASRERDSGAPRRRRRRWMPVARRRPGCLWGWPSCCEQGQPRAGGGGLGPGGFFFAEEKYLGVSTENNPCSTGTARHARRGRTRNPGGGRTPHPPQNAKTLRASRNSSVRGAPMHQRRRVPRVTMEK